jgi:hypothetical protein
MIEFIGTSATGFLNYSQYSAIADLHNLQFIAAHALGFLVFTSRILVTELKMILIVIKSSSHTLSLHRPSSNSSSTTNFPWLSPTDN